MNLKSIDPKRSLNKAYLKEKVTRSSIEIFKKNLAELLDGINEKESEEHVKNNVTKFLYNTYYNGKNQINTKGRIDLAIYEDKKPVVIIEAKRPNSPDMVSVTNLNAKAMHELMLYYLRERIDEGNTDIKYLVATNMYEWFVFDATIFDRLFYKNTVLTKDYNDWKNKRKTNDTTDFFYTDIAAQFLKGLIEEIPFTWFDLRKVEKIVRNENAKDDAKLIPLLKLLSPAHLLKQSFANDSNSLDTKFYSELLHIIGLEEKKDGGKKIIQRKEKPDAGSLVENVINEMIAEERLRELPKEGADFGADKTERLFNVALELCITWINRILFLKLLEGQLLNYHAGNKLYRFLDFKTIPNFDELNKLFFQVLARKVSERTDAIREKFALVPYLNSSLFDISPLETAALRINSLDDSLKLKIASNTVLKTEGGKKRDGEMPALQYLFEFLDAYDFSSEGTEEIQEENKSLINASVLGLIFEKINGYKDGSFFTPGFITMYMCRETIRRAVVQKFNEYLVLTPRPPLRNEEGEAHIRKSSVPKVITVETGLPPQLLKNARELRKNQTDAEELLWQQLRNRKLNNWKFRRQHPLSAGYILDFFCAETNVAIELDGAGHSEKEQLQYDKDRTEVLSEYGIRVIRFWNDEVLNNRDKVLRQIIDFSTTALTTSAPPPSPPWRGAGGEEKLSSLTDLYNTIGKTISLPQANDIINSLKICDPAVGSGHFLVSALNEIIAIKSELGILADRDGKVLRDYAVEVINDELIVSIDDHELFEYKPGNKESQRVQEALFHEKQTLIENCLFGVDINPNSVKICRLRLWIELLKSAYYTSGSKYTELETLPNIDINIKQGNSLISRFALDADLSKVLKSIKYSIDDYRAFVNNYKNATDKDEKRGFEALIEQIKKDFRSEIGKNDPKVLLVNKRSGELYNLLNQARVFEPTEKEKKEAEKKKEKLEAGINKLAAEIQEIKDSAIYKDAFEWRFEFPEVLDKVGGFVGFDMVIGNPPYISLTKIKEFGSYFESQKYETYVRGGDIYCLFYEKGIQILNQHGLLTYVTSNSWLRAIYGKQLIKYFSEKTQPLVLINIEDTQLFEEATVESNIIVLQKSNNHGPFLVSGIDSDYSYGSPLDSYFEDHKFLFNPSKSDEWIIVDQRSMTLKDKLEKNSTPLRDLNPTINFGIKTGYNEAFIVDTAKKDELIKEDKKSGQILKSIIRGRDLKKYSCLPAGLWMITTFPSYDITISDYPAIEKHLLSFGKVRLEQTGKDGSRKKTSNQWFETQDSISYWKDFEGPKIVWGEISDKPKFAYDDTGLFAEATTFLMTGPKLKFLLGILNSRVSEWYFNQISTTTGMGTNRWKKYKVEQFPIRPADNAIENKIVDLVDSVLTLKGKDSDANSTDLEKKIDKLVYNLYQLTEAEIEIIEGK